MSSPLIVGTKLSDKSVRRIVRGFAFGEPVADIGNAAKTTKKAALSIVLALRSRLSAPPFHRWKSPGTFFSTFVVPYQEQVEFVVFGVLMLCYENKRCRSNYLQSRRVGRMCRSCPIATIFEDYPTQQRAIAFADTVAEFYGRLGIGGERGSGQTDRTQIFMLRWAHSMIVLRAMAASGLIDADVPPSGEAPFHDCDALHETLLAELGRQPLVR